MSRSIYRLCNDTERHEMSKAAQSLVPGHSHHGLFLLCLHLSSWQPRKCYYSLDVRLAQVAISASACGVCTCSMTITDDWPGIVCGQPPAAGNDGRRYDRRQIGWEVFVSILVLKGRPPLQSAMTRRWPTISLILYLSCSLCFSIMDSGLVGKQVKEKCS